MAPVVKEAILLAWEEYGNPSGTHKKSRMAEALIEKSREEIAAELGMNPSEVIFTSGSTEAITLAIWGQILGSDEKRSKVLVSAIEHEAVLATAEIACRVAKKQLIVIPVHGGLDSPLTGQIDIEFVSQHIGPQVALIAVMAVNNETGVVQPTKAISEIAQQFEVPFLCDSTQAIGKQENFSMKSSRAIYTLSGHKIYGPKGSGAVIIPREFQKKFVAIAPGGGQERGLRGGTLNAGSAVGLASALKYVHTDLENEMSRQQELRDRFFFGLVERLSNSLTSNSGNLKDSLKNTLNLRFLDAASDAVLVSLKEVAASRASACSAGVEEPSHVLLAMGRTPLEADESIRFSLGRYTTLAEIDAAIEDVSAAVTRVRAFS